MSVSISDGDDDGDSLRRLGAQAGLALQSIYGFPILDCYLLSPPVHILTAGFYCTCPWPPFNLATPFLGVPLYMAHPDPIPPHEAQPPAAPPYPIQSKSSESYPSEMMDSSSSSSSTPDDGFVPADHEPAGFMPN